MLRLHLPHNVFVVGDDQKAGIRLGQLQHDIRHELPHGDVQAGVGLVQDGQFRFEHQHLEHLVPLGLAAGEAFVQVPAGELGGHLQDLHLPGQHRPKLPEADLFAAHGLQRLAEEVADGHAGDHLGVLESQEQPEFGPFVRLQRQQVLARKGHTATGDGVAGMTHQRVGQRRLARTVRAHQHMPLTLTDRQVDALEDLLALDLDPQVADHQLGCLCHLALSSQTRT